MLYFDLYPTKKWDAKKGKKKGKLRSWFYNPVETQTKGSLH